MVSTDTMSANDLTALSKRNHNLELEAMIEGSLAEMIHAAIEKGLYNWSQSLQSMTSSQASLTMVDYQLTNATQNLKQRDASALIDFSYEVEGGRGKHHLLLDKQTVAILCSAILNESIEQSSLTETHYNQVATLLETGIKQFYNRFTEDVNIIVHTTSMKWCEIDIEQFDATYELKVYELSLENHRYHMIHLSDYQFLEYAYSKLEAEQTDDLVFEELIDDLCQPQKTHQHAQVAAAYSKPQVMPELKRPVFSTFEDLNVERANHNLGLLYDVPLEISVVLGKAKRSIREILEINVGKIIELDQFADDPLEVYCNGKLIAEGEVVVVDESFGIKITKLHQTELQDIER